jgi:hypothetical protein
LNAEIELFGVFEFVVDWFAIYRYWPLASTSVYIGFAAGDRFAVDPPVTVFREQELPTVKGSICPGVIGLTGPASVI